MSLAWIALNSVNGLGPVRFKKLLEFYGSPEEVFKTTPEKLLREGIIPEVCIKQLFRTELMDDAEKQLVFASENSVEVMTLADNDYPKYLKEIYAPPPLFFFKGKRSVFKEQAIGIVGTRNPTTYGKSATASITKGLVENKLTVVSGLARGIDTVAHETCVNLNGSTIAVLGSGIDIIYPKQNEKLAEKICEKGALVSEFPMKTSPESFNFPRRNRIISGLCAGVIVIEAGLKSGSLITAHYALQQGRDVFAVPGPINSPMSTGTFNLIRDGAIPARSGSEIAESLNGSSIHQSSQPFIPAQTRLPLDTLSEEECRVYDALSGSPVRIDDLTEKTEISVGLLLSILLNLELKGLVNQISGQQFIRT